MTRRILDRLADRFRRLMHGDAHEDYVRRALEADLNDRECVQRERDR